MKRSFSFPAGLLVAGLLLSSGLSWAGEENWRTRASVEDEYSSGDITAEVAFGREIAARILGRYKAYDSPELVKYLNLVGLALTKNTNRPELDFHFMVLDTREINAYAAPGGYVFVTAGALIQMQDEAELAGVLAHEIGHITEMHVVKELKIKGVDDSTTTGLARLVGGSSESAKAAFGQAVDKGLNMIFNDTYKRADELQADRTAVTLATLSGYDASALGGYLGRVSSQKEKSTVPDDIHPTAASRIKQINEVIASDGISVEEGSHNTKRFGTQIADLKTAFKPKLQLPKLQLKNPLAQ